jgi:hypothetical protein
MAMLPMIAVAPAFTQETKIDKAAKQENEAAAEGDASWSEVKPGPPTIKTKDIANDRRLAPRLRRDARAAVS